jgi:hypothetical protein
MDNDENNDGFHTPRAQIINLEDVINNPPSAPSRTYFPNPSTQSFEKGEWTERVPTNFSLSK